MNRFFSDNKFDSIAAYSSSQLQRMYALYVFVVVALLLWLDCIISRENFGVLLFFSTIFESEYYLRLSLLTA
jgi:hypothetical protein